ncbi:HGxxPAAW family protein [Streptomyces spiramenti]|uniref:HGxxPAAW family protein n=1 Tax=Streptomyces spiramenti TaxID=2720606 RepID=UPI001FD76CD2|nr:HGxxPAAW family protein [Streptomyces spiramenti]
MANGHDHGNTPAAWAGVTIALLGFTVSGVFLTMAQPLGVIAGLVVVALGGVVSLVMRAMGMGKQEEEVAEVTLPAQQGAAESAVTADTAGATATTGAAKADEGEKAAAG